jgi:N6-L-threonylcarbamoyladenine synthase
MSGGELVLGIESSCDDTAAAVVDASGRILSSMVASQIEVHAPFGGVYPEFASRAHVETIIPTVRAALEQAGVEGRQLRAIGVTRGPGLIGPLLVGLNTAAGLGAGWEVPVIGINHLRGHLRSADLEKRRVTYPAIVLLVSGGHTFLAHMEDANAVRVLGSTRDDSVGEAYDKVGRMLGLGYPAGPAMDKLALQGEASIRFPRPMIAEGLEFSFSGLKSAVARYLEKPGSNSSPADVAASFVEASMEILLTKCRRALSVCPSASLVVVGGVAASPQLRSGAQSLCDELGVELCLPPLKWSTDNAAMIALATWDYLAAGIHTRPIVQTRLALGEF